MNPYFYRNVSEQGKPCLNEKGTFMIRQIPLEEFLVIDIETVSEQKEYRELNPEWQLLWDEKTRWSRPEDSDAEAFYPQRAGVMAEFAKVICICIGFFHRQNAETHFRVKAIAGNDEKTVLQQFIDTVAQFGSRQKKWRFAGHNIREFDIPFLCRRMLINSIALPSFLDFQNLKPWENNLVDTFQLWRFGDYKQFTSLKLLAAALGVPSPKDDIDGSQVGQVYWEEGNLERIALYCRKDVATVANILLRFRNESLLETQQLVFV
jgi:hypothetical protein